MVPQNTNPFASEGKFMQRQKILDFARRPYPFHSAVMLPAEFNKEPRSGLMQGLFDKGSTEFTFLEKKKDVVLAIEKFVASSGIKANPVFYHHDGLEAINRVPLQHVDYVNLDLCGMATDRIVAWIARHFLTTPRDTFDVMPFISFTFCLYSRGVTLSYLDRIAEKTKLTGLNPEPEFFGFSETVDVANMREIAQKMYRAMTMLLPGKTLRSKTIVYQSADTPMVTFLFDVYTDMTLAHQRLFYLTDILGLDLENATPVAVSNPQPATVTEVKPPSHQGRLGLSIDIEKLGDLVGEQSKSALSREIGFHTDALAKVFKRKRASEPLVDALCKKFGVERSAFIIVEKRRRRTSRRGRKRSDDAKIIAFMDVEKLKTLVANSGMSQSDIARRMKYSIGLITNINKTGRTSLETAKKLGKVLKVDYTELVTEQRDWHAKGATA